LALANLAMLLMLLLWALSLFGTKARGALGEGLRNRLVTPALALFAWVLVAIIWSPAAPEGALGFLQKYLKFAMVPVFIALLQDGAVRRRCWQAFAVAMGFTLVVTWLNVWFDFPWTRTHNRGFGRDHTVVKDYISQGLMMTVFTAVCVFVALGQSTRARRAGVWLLWGLASASILLLLQGRTGYLAWAASTSVLAFHASRLIGTAALKNSWAMPSSPRPPEARARRRSSSARAWRSATDIPCPYTGLKLVMASPSTSSPSGKRLTLSNRRQVASGFW